MKSDLAKLLEIAKKKPETPIKEEHFVAPLPKFIQADNIQKGNTWIMASLIYVRYYEWAKANNEKEIMGDKKFFRELKYYFNKREVKGNSYYQMGSNGFDLSDENIARAKEKRISYGKKKKSYAPKEEDPS